LTRQAVDGLQSQCMALQLRHVSPGTDSGAESTRLPSASNSRGVAGTLRVSASRSGFEFVRRACHIIPTICILRPASYICVQPVCRTGTGFHTFHCRTLRQPTRPRKQREIATPTSGTRDVLSTTFTWARADECEARCRFQPRKAIAAIRHAARCRGPSRLFASNSSVTLLLPEADPASSLWPNRSPAPPSTERLGQVPRNSLVWFASCLNSVPRESITFRRHLLTPTANCWAFSADAHPRRSRCISSSYYLHARRPWNHMPHV